MSTSSPTSTGGIKIVGGGGDFGLTTGLDMDLATSNASDSEIQYLCKRGRIVDRKRDIDDVG